MRTIHEEHIHALEFYRDTISIWWKEKRLYGTVTSTDYSDIEEFYDLEPIQQVSHALWMTEEMLRMNKKENGNIATDKVARWLGFIQCVLIMNKLTTIKEERNRTRPWFRKELL